MERKYKSYCTVRGKPVRKLDDLKIVRWRGAAVNLYCDDVYVGSGELHRFTNKSVHTDGVYLERGFRKKGHGIPLYLAMIRTAKKLKANRIYSGTSLNRFSRRMWGEKLAKLFVVKNSTICKKACRHCRRKNRYYIVLKGVKV